MKAVMDTTNVKKRVRLILGLNEEKSWKCIHYYKKHEEHPTIGFSPDADFPCIYAEKGIITAFFKQNYLSSDIIKIIEVDTNNNAINVVPKYCSIVLKLDSCIKQNEFICNAKKIIDKNEFEIDLYAIDSNTIKLTSHGISAHAAHPDLGINAISRLLVVLYEIFNTYNVKIPLLELFYNCINTQYNGSSLGLESNDESGTLTVNVGKFNLDNNTIEFGLNIRIPVTIPLNDISKKLGIIANNYDNIYLNISEKKEPLYIDKSNTLVKTLCNIFNTKTNLDMEPIAIGGATYARAFDNCISFGANMPGNKDMCHQVDEYIEIDNLILSAKIYAEAIYELSR